MKRRILSAKRKTLIGIGFLALALAVGPVPAHGESPAVETISGNLSRNALSETLLGALPRPASNDAVSLKIMPHTSGPLTISSARNLFMGFTVSLERVREIPSCNALFEPFAASGVDKMTTSFYVAPNANERRELCVGGVTAFTQVGRRVTRLCPGFGDVDRQTAAQTLIHEALHSAGMPESPSTAGARTPSEINRLVKRACGL